MLKDSRRLNAIPQRKADIRVWDIQNKTKKKKTIKCFDRPEIISTLLQRNKIQDFISPYSANQIALLNWVQ